MRLIANLALALSLAISFAVPSSGHAHQARRHHVHRQDDLVARDPGEINLYKRFDNARFTYYAVGVGSCGFTDVPSNFIVALNAAQYDGGIHCSQSITITVGGKTTQALIHDLCPGCPVGGLDMSQGLFEFFADISVGVLTGSWEYSSGGAPAPAPSPSPSPAPSPSPSPSPSPAQPTTSVDIPLTGLLPSQTTTSQPPPTTTTSAPITTSSSGSVTSAVSSSNSTQTSTQTTSVPVAATAGVVPGGTNSSILFDVNLSMVYIGQFLGFCNGL